MQSSRFLSLLSLPHYSSIVIETRRLSFVEKARDLGASPSYLTYYEMEMTSDQLYFRNIPALSFPFIQLPQVQLDFLLSNTRSLLETLERAKKGVVVLDHFQSRLSGKQVVRCTPQSVRVTAAARYAPNPDDLNLSSITTTLFVHLITYLPLPEIRVLAGNHDALHEASKISMNEDIDQRWGTYYTYLASVNKEWAQLFFIGWYQP